MKILLARSCLVATSLVALLPSPPVRAVESAVAAAIARGDACDEQLQTNEALAAYLEAEKLGGSGSALLRKISREYALAMPDAKSREEQRVLGEKSVTYSQRAIAVDPTDALAQLGLAICCGRVAPLLDNKTKIAYSKLVKEHAEKAVKLDASLDYAYHVLGAWNYEMASLNPVLRVLAKLIYGDLPAASYEEAVRNFEKAIELAPHRVAHRVELGRTYAAMGQNELARAEINRGLALASREKDDPGTKERGREALKKL